MLLSLDPSVRSPGVALFREGILVHAARVKLETRLGDLDEGPRWLGVADAIVRHVEEQARGSGITRVVYERPQIYRAAKSKGDPNDLIGLAAVGAGVAAFFAALNWDLVVSAPTPRDWAGSSKKATTGSAFASPRAKRFLPHFSEEERALIPDQHDACDAAFLGAWHLGRAKLKRAYSNGR